MWYYSKTHLPIGTAQEYFKAWTVLYIIKHKVCVCGFCLILYYFLSILQTSRSYNQRDQTIASLLPTLKYILTAVTAQLRDKRR